MKKLYILVILTFYSVLTFAQVKINALVINPKVGFYIYRERVGGAGGMEIQALSEEYIYSVDYYHFEESNWGYEIPAERYHQMGLMFGKYEESYNEKFRFHYQLGPSVIWGKGRGELIQNYHFKNFIFPYDSNIYSTQKFATLGLTLKTGFKFVIYKRGTLGIDLQANINNKRGLFFSMVSLEMKIPRRKGKQ